MRVLAAIIVGALLVQCGLAGTPPPPHKPYHLLLGPYEYDASRRHLPRYFTLDDKPYGSIDTLKAAIAALPPESTVYLRGSCEPYDTIDLPPRAISLSALRAYCNSRHITFTWTFGPGGY